MSEKAQENWESAYTGKVVTYAEDPRNPSDLEQLWNYKVVCDHIVHYLSDIKNPKIIEVGCGGARNALYLALHGFDVTCTDYSEEALRLARANFNAFNAKGAFLLDDLMDSNIPDNTFDCVMSFGLLEHFSDLKPIIDNLTRIIKPGGIHIHLVIPKKFSTQTIMNILAFPVKLANNLIVRRQPLRGILRRSYRNFPHYENTFLWHEYCEAFEKSHNDVLKCEPGGLILPFTFWPTYIGLGYPVVKLFQRPINKINDCVRRSTSPLIYRLSQTYTIIGRKR
jgi:2-polyprenyl-3-methyl-5-hydroxy-6-metoxy-1,4-benzoquinol methylase